MTARLRFNIKLVVLCVAFFSAMAYAILGAMTGFAPPFETFYLQTNAYRWTMPFDLLSRQRIGVSFAVLLLLFRVAFVGRRRQKGFRFQSAGSPRTTRLFLRYGAQCLLLTVVFWVSFHQAMRQDTLDWFLAISAVLVAAVVTCGLTRPWWGRMHQAVARLPIIPTLLCAAAGALLLGFFCVHYGQAIITDAQSQIAQARLILTGHVRITLSDQLLQVAQLPNFLTTNPTYSQYPPGHILLLVPIIAAGLPGNILNVICGVAAVFFSIKLCRSMAGRSAAFYAGLLLITSPLFMAMQSSAMNHGSTTLMLVAAAWAFYQVIWRRQNGLLWVGVLALGWAGITRPLTALCHAAIWTPILGYYFYQTLIARSNGLGQTSAIRAWKAIIIAVAVGAAPITLLGIYNWQTTGNPMLMGYIANNPAMHRLGFHTDGPYPYAPAEAVQFAVSDMLSLSKNMFGWPMSSWVLILGWLLLSRLTAGELIVAALILGQSIVYRFYHFYDLLIGPRFVSELMPFYAILGGIGVSRFFNRLDLQWRHLAQVVIVPFSAMALISGISLWADKLSMFTSKHVLVEEVLHENPVKNRTRVIMVPWNYAETAGEYTFGGKFPTWFILDTTVEKARKAPELQDADWVQLLHQSKTFIPY